MIVSQSKRNISIIYFSIGSGHQMAAEALANTLKAHLPNSNIQVFDPFASLIDPMILEKIQGASITLTPEIYNSVWQRGMPGNIFERLMDLDLLQNVLLKGLHLEEDNIIIATHVIPCAISAAIKQNTGLIHKVYGVVTDFGIHSLWPLVGIDGYFVGHEEIRNIFGYRGADTTRVYVTGIPLRDEFSDLQPKKLFVSPEQQTQLLNVMFVAGGLRSGGYSELQQELFDILDSLEKLADDHLNLTIVSGNNKRLHGKLLSYTKTSKLRMKIHEFVDNMPELMCSQDLLISKPGGLIVAESLALGLPMIVLQPGPGQERANESFLARHGSVMRGESPERIYNIIKLCLTETSYLQEIRIKSRALGFPSATHSIACHILSELTD